MQDAMSEEFQFLTLNFNSEYKLFTIKLEEFRNLQTWIIIYVWVKKTTIWQIKSFFWCRKFSGIML